jgi:NAD(P)-dependent dehydrogenase (short-subunit alcohol dehydrogenase family)
MTSARTDDDGETAAAAYSDLRGVRAIVTGSAGDIGAAIVAELRACGARVSGIDVRDPGGVDITDRAAVDAAFAAHGPVDVVIANAGIVESAPFLDITADQWRRHLDVNLTGSFNVAQAAARAMVAQGRGGRIVFTGSWIQDIPWPEVAAYSATKAAIKMLARSMALELAPHRILVNVLAPGIVDAGVARQQRLTEPQYAQRAARVIPLGELQTPEQVARAAVFLCSPAADSMTGAVLLLDGGCSLFHVDSEQEP